MWFRRTTSRPSAENVARRLLVLKYVVAYTFLVPPEKNRQHWSAAEQEKFADQARIRRDQFWQGLHTAGLGNELTAEEREYAASTPATMTPSQQINASWRMEAAQVLLWALGLLPALPPWGELADPAGLQAIPAEDPGTFIREAALRPAPEIDRAREMAEMWHWRSRTQQLVMAGEVLRPDARMKAAGLLSYDDIVREAAARSHRQGLIPLPMRDDFPVRGKAYRELTEEEWTEVRSISFERHFALNWLTGRAPRNRWDRTPTPT